MVEAYVQVAQSAFEHCQVFLNSIADTIDIKDVRDNEEYQDLAVDLRWIRETQKGAEPDTKLIKFCYSPEPSPDRYFFEILNGEDKRKPGWFSSSKADLLFYYFLEARELHILLLEEFRPWLVKNMKNFRIQPCPSNDVLPVPMGIGCVVRRDALPSSLAKTIVKVDMSECE